MLFSPRNIQQRTFKTVSICNTCLFLALKTRNLKQAGQFYLKITHPSGSNLHGNSQFTDGFIENQGDVVQRRLKQVIETDADVFLNVFRIYAGTEMAPWLHEVTAPSLVLTGENDGGCNPRLNKQIDAALPNSELVILPDYKHSLLLEAGDIVAENLAHFISRLQV